MEKKYGEIWTNPGTNFGEIWAIICPRILLCRQVCWTTNHDLFSGYKLPRKHCARHPGSWSGIIPAMNIISYHRISHRTDVSWCFYHFQVSQHSFGISCRHLGDRIPTSTNWPGPQRPRPSKHLRTLAFLGARSGKQTHEKWRNMLENRWCFSSAENGVRIKWWSAQRLWLNDYCRFDHEQLRLKHIQPLMSFCILVSLYSM